MVTFPVGKMKDILLRGNKNLMKLSGFKSFIVYFVNLMDFDSLGQEVRLLLGEEENNPIISEGLSTLVTVQIQQAQSTLWYISRISPI